ncbi:SH3 domain-containing protein [Streptomyces corynorhini]|uniref:SH3 domain-containing protein n=1 Tax=Streptomyces corynorhini TaxID=2282652 RepID=A0A370AY05_9ACTN|nr:SH3 domain-containing protein [Streptomyces corynorhini]RDG34221.1 SH3 domain-containing protein [Streptomyces corynorhini]
MHVRSLGRTAATLAVTTVAAAALALTAVAPASAAPTTTAAASTAETAAAPAVSVLAAPGDYLGEVTARTGLLLHDKPYRSARVVGSVEYGQIVRIFCRVNADDVEGNSTWYLLADGRWAWASAKYIRSIGAVPHLC